MPDEPQIARRKREHLQINLDHDVQAKGVSTGLERFRLTHRALPEVALSDVDTTTTFLGRSLQVPFLISGMTGGVADGLEINRRLARGAQAVGCAMGVGSQRAGLADSALEPFYQVRDVAPDILLIANLGAVQLNYGFGVEECRRAVDMINADALAFHLNPLQEAVQPEGNSDFSGLLAKIEQVCAALPMPVIVKEVGWGISGDVARRLLDVGITAIDVGGAGGTSWSEVERYRAPTALHRRICATFAGWGIPTADSIGLVRAASADCPLIASGGLRTGLDAALALALGADLAGFAAPLLRAAAVSDEAVAEELTALREEFRIAMFCTASSTIADLKRAGVMPTDRVLGS